jgi:hypothetical protein
MAKKVSKKRPQSFQARFQSFKKNGWMKRDWKIVTYGVEWVAILSSLFWAIEARTSEIKLPRHGIEPSRSLAKIAPKQNLNQVSFPRMKRSEVLTQEKKVLFLEGIQATEKVSFGSALSAEFKQFPFYSPTTVVLLKF